MNGARDERLTTGMAARLLALALVVGLVSVSGLWSPIAWAQDSPLKPRDLPPDGVPEQIASFDPAGARARSCVLGSQGLFEFNGAACSLEITDSLSIDIEAGFQSNLLTSIAVDFPDGTVSQWSVSGSAVSWFSEPGEPLGTYRLTAVQGSRRVSGTFVVRRKTEPSVLFGSDSTFPCAGCGLTFRPGETINVYMAGYAPNSRVPAFIYRRFRDVSVPNHPGWGEYRFMSSIGPVQMNARGEAAFSISTSWDDGGNFEFVTIPDVEPTWTARFNIGN